MTTLTSDNHLYIPSLPHVAVDRISGFLEVLGDEGGRERLAILANHLNLTTDDLLVIVEAVNLLGFVRVDDSDVVMTVIGKGFAEATICQRRSLFREQVLANVPQIAWITRLLRQEPGFEQNTDRCLERFKEAFPGTDADQQFAIAVEWGRYANLFDYQAMTKRLHLLPSKG